MPVPELNQICQEAKKDIQEIDVVQLQRMQAEKEDFELIDVREKDQVARGKIRNVKHLSKDILKRYIDQIATDKSRTLVFTVEAGIVRRWPPSI